MGEPAFSNHGVWRPLVEEDDGVGDMYWLRWHGRDCRRRRHRSHGIVVVRRSKIQPSNFFAGTTRVAALCRHWWSPTKREMRMSVLPWRWLWKLFEAIFERVLSNRIYCLRVLGSTIMWVGTKKMWPANNSCINNVNVRHTYWAPLMSVTDTLHADDDAVELTFIFLWLMQMMPLKVWPNTAL